MTDPTSLSPAAQAVLDAVVDETRPISEQRELAVDIAAALRAAANQLLGVQWDGQIPADKPHRLGINWSRDALYAIATELEAQ